MRSICVVSIFVFALGAMAPVAHAQAIIGYFGNASGGTLSLGYVEPCIGMKQRNVFQCATIALEANDTPSSIACKMADALEMKSLLRVPAVDRRPSSQNLSIRQRALGSRENSTLWLDDFGYEWVTSGTGGGLHIPEPICSTTAHIDDENGEVRLSWQQRESYDWVKFRSTAADICVSPIYTRIANNSHIIPVADLGGGGPKGEWAFVYCVGVKMSWGENAHETPSNAAGITLLAGGQEELFAIPFFAGIAPNWSRWATGASVVLSEGSKREIRPDEVRIETPDEKPFYQVISNTEEGASGGVWRHFLGLTPGHTYRLSVRVNTLDAGASGAPDRNGVADAWRFSVHATPNRDPSVDGLANAQFNGEAALPDGSTGREAGLLAAFDRAKTTNGKWEKVVTGGSAAPADITIPPGFDSITVWLRLTGCAPSGVGMDWIRLEDRSD